MLKLLLTFVTLLTFPMMVTASSSASALGYTVTVSDQTWGLAHEEQWIEITKTGANEIELLAYETLIYSSKDLLQSITLQATFIGLFILALIVFCIRQPHLLTQPLVFLGFLVCVLFAIHIYDQLATLRIHAENLRYYFLVLTT